uniref:Uncharacterized protein n=1 Tax=Rhizophora mucronata TaxID=61149 RepID=A0A2P2J272_RHIMU
MIAVHSNNIQWMDQIIFQKDLEEFLNNPSSRLETTDNQLVIPNLGTIIYL